MRKIFIVTIFLFCLSSIFYLSLKEDFPKMKGAYLGQKPPRMIPEIFGKGIVSTNHSENSLCASLDGKELYFTVNRMRPYLMVWMRYGESGWTNPETMSFSGNYSDWDFNISPDGKKLYYTSNRPLSGKGQPDDNNNIWVVTKTDNGWSEPEKLDSPVNSDGYEGHPSITREGTLYFHHLPRDRSGDWYIYRSQLVNGKYLEKEKLPAEINGIKESMDPFIAQDESYLIFLSTRYLEENAPTNFYISFRKNDGTWSEAKNMGEFIKIPGSTPTVTIDENYFFFNSYDRTDKAWSEKRMTYKEKINQLNGPESLGAVYWIDAKIIGKLKVLAINSK